MILQNIIISPQSLDHDNQGILSTSATHVRSKIASLVELVTLVNKNNFDALSS